MYLNILKNHTVFLKELQEDVEMVIGRLVMSTICRDGLKISKPSENEKV